MIEVVGAVLSIANGLLDARGAVAGAKAERREQIATYFEQIANALTDLGNGLRQENPEPSTFAAASRLDSLTSALAGAVNEVASPPAAHARELIRALDTATAGWETTLRTQLDQRRAREEALRKRATEREIRALTDRVVGPGARWTPPEDIRAPESNTEGLVEMVRGLHTAAGRFHALADLTRASV